MDKVMYPIYTARYKSLTFSPEGEIISANICLEIANLWKEIGSSQLL